MAAGAFCSRGQCSAAEIIENESTDAAESKQLLLLPLQARRRYDPRAYVLLRKPLDFGPVVALMTSGPLYRLPQLRLGSAPTPVAQNGAGT